MEMLKITELVFEVLEKGWATVDHALIDMKVEFGVLNTSKGSQIVLADVVGRMIFEIIIFSNLE